MGLSTNPNLNGQDGSDERRMKREARRYGRIIARLLPAWAPAPIISRLHDELAHYQLARREARARPGVTPRLDQQWFARQVASTVRLCTYSPDMERAWATLTTAPLRGQDRSGWTASDRTLQVLSGIDNAMCCASPTRQNLPRQRAENLSHVWRRLADACLKPSRLHRKRPCCFASHSPNSLRRTNIDHIFWVTC